MPHPGYLSTACGQRVCAMSDRAVPADRRRHDHFITTPATGSVCRCRAVILTGIAEGIHTRVDLIALNRDGEVGALLSGLNTYTLARTGLIRRDAWRIGDTVLARAGPVLAEHRCGRETPAGHRHRTAPPPPDTGLCPY